MHRPDSQRHTADEASVVIGDTPAEGVNGTNADTASPRCPPHRYGMMMD